MFGSKLEAESYRRCSVGSDRSWLCSAALPDVWVPRSRVVRLEEASGGEETDGMRFVDESSGGGDTRWVCSWHLRIGREMMK